MRSDSRAGRTEYTLAMEPVILIVAGDPAEGARLRGELGRYERDDRLEVATSGAAALDRIVEVAAEGGAVAMVLAELAQPASDGVGVLAAARSVTRTARSVLLLEWGLRPEQGPAVSRAMALGAVDIVLTKPSGPRDEEFHATITAELGEWAWTTTPAVEAVRVVSADDRRAAEIHALLDRLGVPSGIHAPGSDVAATIAGRSPEPTWRILVEVMGTTVLADPTNRDLAIAFGVCVDVESTVFDVAIVGSGPAGLGALWRPRPRRRAHCRTRTSSSSARATRPAKPPCTSPDTRRGRRSAPAAPR